jgi:hypothetical protein
MRYRLLILLLLCLTANLSVQAQGFSETRTYKRAFSAGKGVSLEITNKYGTIQVTNGNSDSVRVHAEVIASSSNIQRMRKMLNGVSINMAETAYSIRVQSDFSANPGFLFEDLKNLTGKLIPYENRLQVNYYITVPRGIALKIANMYGDVYLEDVMGSLDLTLSNGSLQTGYIQKATNISLSFVNGTMMGIGSGRTSFSYSELRIGESGDLNITTRSSKMELAAVEELSLNSRRDKIFIGSLNSINADSYFSDISIESVSEEVILKTSYGSFRAPSLLKSLSLLSVNSQLTELFFGLETGLRAGIDIKTTSTRTSLPESNGSLSMQVLNSEKNESVTFGYLGGDKPGARIKIDAIKGSLTIKYN